MSQPILGSTPYQGFTIVPYPGNPLRAGSGKGFWVSYGGTPVGRYFATQEQAKTWIDEQNR